MVISSLLVFRNLNKLPPRHVAVKTFRRNDVKIKWPHHFLVYIGFFLLIDSRSIGVNPWFRYFPAYSNLI
jgi:hypothetical protein